MSAFVAPSAFRSFSPRLTNEAAKMCTSITLGSLRAAAVSSQTLSRRSVAPSFQVSPVMEMEVEDEIIEEPAPIPEDTKLFVGNLDWETTNESLGKAFDHFGNVVDARVITDRFTGKSRGFGFVEFDGAEAASTALAEMDGAKVDGRHVRVDRANKREPKRRYF